MQPSHPPILALIAILAAVPLSGCLGGDDSDSASMSLFVKDAITDDFESIYVTFASVHALPEHATAWETVFEGNRTIDLLSLRDSTAKEKLAELNLEARPYSGLSLAVTQAYGVTHNGTEVPLVVAGDVLEIRERFDPGADEDLALLVDIDLETGTDAANGTFVPHAANVQSSAVDTDGDGIPDIDDADDDNDGIPDAEDDDLDGDGQSDRPEQSVRGHFGLCTAWRNTETARQHSDNVSNSSGFQSLAANATASNQTIDDYCAEQQPPGPPESVPEQAYAAWEQAQQRRADAQANRDRGGAGNQTQPGGTPDGAGNGTQSGQGGSSGNETQPGDPPEGAGNQTGAGARP